MTAANITHISTEVIHNPTVAANITHISTEVLHNPTVAANITHISTEVIHVLPIVRGSSIEYVWGEDLNAVPTAGLLITSSSQIDTTFSRSGFWTKGSTRRFWQITLPNKIDDFWFVCTHKGDYENSRPIISLFDDGVEFFRVRTTSELSLKYLDMQLLEGGFTSHGVTNITLDNLAVGKNFGLHIFVHPTNGIIECFIQGELAFREIGINTAGSAISEGVNKIQLDASGSIEDAYYSEIIMANNVNIINYRVSSFQPIADGFVNEWTAGSFADVDEITKSDGDIVLSGIIDKNILFEAANVASNNLEPVAVSIHSRALKGTIGPQNANVIIRTNGTTFDIEELTGLATTYSEFATIIDNNPSTDQPFTVTEINELEYGFVTRT